jgi:hypothetical protein
MRIWGIASAFETMPAFGDRTTLSADEAPDGVLEGMTRVILFGP